MELPFHLNATSFKGNYEKKKPFKFADLNQRFVSE